MPSKGINRRTAVMVNRILDQWMPPVVRDNKLIMWPLLRVALGKNWRLFTEFKDRLNLMSDAEFSDVYRQVSHDLVHGDSDLNDACVEKIEESVIGDSVLDAGCGRVYLAARLGKRWKTSGCDLLIDANLRSAHPNVDLREGSVESLPYADNEFDTVVCTHTLEHVRNLPKAIGELRRVARKRIIIVVPRQRSYRYTFNLHIHFFPYTWALRLALQAPADAVCELVDGDYLYIEDVEGMR